MEFLLLSLTFLVSIVASCGNYWQSNNDGASSSRRPFDICYRSYRDNLKGDYSYRYICNETVVNENYTVNGHTVFKQFFNGVGCVGEPNATILEDTLPFSIHCGGTDCNIVRYRVYDVDPNDEQMGQCNGDNYPQSILSLNNYAENVHVIERCDDDGFTSDSYFCSNDYFYINSYNNDKCDNDGIYAAQYFFEGCNYDEDEDDYQYVEVIGCGKDSGFTQNDKGLEIWGIIFIVLALVAVLCAIVFVIYHCRKSTHSYSVAVAK